MELRAGELESLPVSDGELDVALLFLVLHHVAEPPIVLAEAARQETAVDQTLAAFSHSIAGVIAARDAAEGRTETLDVRVAELEGEIQDWRAQQEVLLAQIEEATQTEENYREFAY